MKLGELIVELGTKGNTKELEKTLSQLKEAEKKLSAQIKLNKDLAKATTEEEKALIREHAALKNEISAVEKSINKNKERNKTIAESVKGFTRLIGAISLAIGVMDRFANASAKTNQNVLTTAQTSGVDVNTINKYASAAKSVNYNVTRETVAQTFDTLSKQILEMNTQPEGGTQLAGALSLLSGWSQSSVDFMGKDAVGVLESIREPLRKLDDIKASHILSMMGISPDLLPMLRMSTEEFNKIPNRFLSAEQMKEEQRKSLELQEKRDALSKTWEETLIDLYPVLNNVMEALKELAPTLGQIIKDITPALITIAKALGPIAEWLGKTYKWSTTPLKRKDVEYAEKAGEKAREKMNEIKQNAKRAYDNIRNTSFQDNRNITIHTTQPPSTVIPDANNIQTYNQVQPTSK
ncbi:MAG: hypothetical protein J6T10_26765 [Methanobrevibacter sp.]|nr:hypothetical protein [Methanobrevibacter sp.]